MDWNYTNVQISSTCFAMQKGNNNNNNFGIIDFSKEKRILVFV